MYSFIPFVLIACGNVFLSLRLQAESQMNCEHIISKVKQKQKNMNITVFFMTLIFTICTFPLAIITVLYSTLIISDYGFLIILIGNTICFAYHGFNSIILIITNKTLKKEVLHLAGIKRGHVSSVNKHNNNNNDQNMHS